MPIGQCNTVQCWCHVTGTDPAGEGVRERGPDRYLLCTTTQPYREKLLTVLGEKQRWRDTTANLGRALENREGAHDSFRKIGDQTKMRLYVPFRNNVRGQYVRMGKTYTYGMQRRL